MIPAITDEPVHRLVEQAEADRIGRPKNSAAASRRSKSDPDHLLLPVRAEDGREVAAAK
ncbi:MULTISPECIES: hypothetical protein [unclassified Streptomyces]|uniref:hypothetical protein n=1 Tax=unclassified Streptomyces TaxID=2593676 RepID=UPI0015CF1286|nr:hypothetical protein [Streptomyces sp. wa1063]